MWKFSIHTHRGMEGLLHKELLHALPKENIFPMTTAGAVAGTAQSRLPLWRAKASLFARNFRYRLHGPVLCTTLSDFRLRMRSELDWSEISLADFRVHTKQSKLFHEKALLEIVKEEHGRVSKSTKPRFKGDLLHIDLVENNLEVSLNVWSDDRKFLPVHAALVKAGAVYFADKPTKTIPVFPEVEWLGVDQASSWNLPETEGSEYFFRVAQNEPIAFGIVTDRKSEKIMLEKLKSVNHKEVWVVARARSNFETRLSSFRWQPQLRWTDQSGPCELFKLVRM